MPEATHKIHANEYPGNVISHRTKPKNHNPLEGYTAIRGRQVINLNNRLGPREPLKAQKKYYKRKINVMSLTEIPEDRIPDFLKRIPVLENA